MRAGDGLRHVGAARMTGIETRLLWVRSYVTARTHGDTATVARLETELDTRLPENHPVRPPLRRLLDDMRTDDINHALTTSMAAVLLTLTAATPSPPM